MTRLIVRRDERAPMTGTDMNDRMASIDDLKIDSPAPRKAKRRRRWPLVGAVIALALVAGGAWFFRGHFGLKPTPVEVYTVPADHSGNGAGFAAGGYLEVIPPGPVIVSALVEGRVQSLEVIEGQSVESGQVLARLDDALFRQEVMVLEAKVALDRAKLNRLEAGFRTEEIAQAQAELERAKARFVAAKADYERKRDLGSSVVPQRNVELAQAELVAAQADVLARQAEVDLRTRGYRKEDIAIARAELNLAESELERAKWKANACVIKAPLAGVVLERFAQPGDWLSLTVSPSNQRERPNAIVSLVDPNRVQAWVDVNQRDSGRVFVGQAALLATDAEPGRPIKGRVSRILPKANLQKNTVRVNVEIPEVSADLRPEMSVKVTFVAGGGVSRASPGVVVPASAVLQEGSRSVVYLHVGGRVRVREVETAGETSGKVTLLSGVAPGDQIVVNPEGLLDGQAVEARK